MTKNWRTKILFQHFFRQKHKKIHIKKYVPPKIPILVCFLPLWRCWRLGEVVLQAHGVRRSDRCVVTDVQVQFGARVEGNIAAEIQLGLFQVAEVRKKTTLK